MQAFHIERLSVRTWKIVEADRFGQYPFLYVVLGADKCIVIDTGCGVADFRGFVDAHVNRSRLPYLVLCTHVHFDVRTCGRVAPRSSLP
jgi:glyoxylase-like metal-dependent hydrolase (beta-lactamase superfamily II)